MIQTVTQFPPSFQENPWSYGFALFSLTAISAIALSVLLHMMIETHRYASSQRMFARPTPIPLPWTLVAFRIVIAGFLSTIVCGALPNVLVMLAWGEASVETMRCLFLIDRAGDGITLFPFLVAIVFYAWGRQSNEQLMMTHTKGAKAELPPFNLRVLKQYAKMFIVVLFIAVGVTIGKASA